MAAARGPPGLRHDLTVPLSERASRLAPSCSAGPRRPFTDKQIKLLKTFADQAVIAIENVRLFRTETARTSAGPADGDERDPAASSPARRPTSSRCSTPSAENAVRVCGADDALLWRLDGDHTPARRDRGAAEPDKSVPRADSSGLGGRASSDRSANHPRSRPHEARTPNFRRPGGLLQGTVPC